MKMMKGLYVLFGLVIGIGFMMSFSRAESQNDKPAISQSGEQNEGVVICYLQSRNNIVAISRGPEGDVYTVKTKDGKIMAAKLNEADFQEKYPALYQQIKSSVAANDATLRTNFLIRDGIITR
jgi:hypothetical protein